jgi:hypothetical protein
MQAVRIDQVRHSRFRFVFGKKAVTFSLASNVTYGDIARTLAENSRRSYGSQVAIDVAVRRPETSFVRHLSSFRG